MSLIDSNIIIFLSVVEFLVLYKVGCFEKLSYTFNIDADCHEVKSKVKYF